MRATVIKQDHNGGFVLQYDGELVERGDQSVCIEAYFSRDYVAPYVTFRKSDRMTEWFYADRCYNIFRIEDVETKQLKGWYCNFTTPATFTFDEATDHVTVRSNDLALDVFVDPHGKITLLDEDEFAALNLPDDQVDAVIHATEQLRKLVMMRSAPFDEISRNRPVNKQRIQAIAPLIEADLQPLLQFSLDEGYNFIQKLLDEYTSGVNRFDTPGAALLAVYDNDYLIGIGGVHRDPYLDRADIGRIRHVYVLPDYRRDGVGKRLMNALIDYARSHFHTLTLRTPTAHANAFYRAIGFSVEPRFADATHWMTLNADTVGSVED